MPTLIERTKEALGVLLGRGGAAVPRLEDELGFGGAKICGGIIQDEHVAELWGNRGLQTAAKMRRSDSQVRAVTSAISLPIRSTCWYVQAAEGAGSAEKEAAELLQENLLGGMECSWDDVLREASLGIFYGWRVPEIVWEERAGLLAVKKLAPRNPELVERWLYGPQGELVGYLYAGNRPVGGGLGDFTGSTRFDRVAVPLEKTVHFVYDAETDSPQGFGLWRSMYQPWYIKSALLKILSIGIERNLLDVPVGKLGRNTGNVENARRKLLTILRRWRAAEDAAVVLAEGEELDFKGSQRALMDAMPFLYYQDWKISQAGLCTFLNLGQSAVGTQSLGAELAKIFLDAENAHGKWIADTLNAQLVRRWVALNYGEGLRAPRITFRPIRSRDPGSWANALNTLGSGGWVHPSVEDEEKLREEFELPAIPREQLESRSQPSQPAPAPATEQVVTAGCEGHGHRFAEDVEQARARRQAQEQGFTERATALLEGIQSGYLAALRPLVERAGSAEELPDLAQVQVPRTREYEAFVRSYLREVFDLGREAFREETGSEGLTEVSSRTRSWINARAKVIAADHVGQLQTAVLTRVLTGIRAELPAEQIFSDAGATAIEQLSRMAQVEWNQAAAEVLALLEGA